MPSRLRPTAPIAGDALLVGDPGRALLLAQELLEEPKMSNHARGLWGYTGAAAGSGGKLTIQATGMGGPSAALVLADLAKLGVRRAIRIGTCAPAAPETRLGELVLVEEAVAEGGSAASFGLAVGEVVSPDGSLTAALGEALGTDARAARVASFDAMPDGEAAVPGDARVADMQTVAVLARARSLGIAAAAVLITAESRGGGEALDDERRDALAKRAGAAAQGALSTSS